MKLIDFSGISASKGYPIIANNPNALMCLDFIQQAYKELFAKCAQIGSPSANATILEGLALTGGSISAGGVYYNGEIFLYNGGNIAGSSNTYIACSWVQNPTDGNPYQTVLSDGSQVSIHNQRTLTFTYSATPNNGNLPDYGTWVLNQVALNTQAISGLQPGAWIPMAGGYNNSWADYGNGYNAGRFRLEGNTLVLSGAISGGASGTSVIIMSPGYRPLNAILIQVPFYSSGLIDVGYLTLATNGNLTLTYPGSPTFASLEGIRIPLN